ncbi:MAG: lipase [Prevotella sp.]|nr:lipase [Prevotella sp.]
MKQILTALAGLLLLPLFLSASTTLPIKGTVITPTDSCIRYIGRFSWRNPSRPAFNWPGTVITTDFQGTSVKLIAKPRSGYFMCWIDNAAPFKVGLNSEKDSVVTLATALPNARHSLRLMYIIEGLDRRTDFRGLVLDEGCTLLPPRRMPERRIEFIGNSITCGYGVESTNASDPFEDETENHALTFANIVSDSLHALHTSISRSGIGVYRNYNGPAAGSRDPMPWQYEFTLFNDSTEQWDFSLWTPDLVCINLGTNDFSTTGWNKRLYEEAYRKFILQVRRHYPHTPIVLLNGPMLGEREDRIEAAILDRLQRECKRRGDKEVHRFSFSRQTGELGYGASWHPSKQQHERMAAELLPFLKTIMRWEASN